MNNDNNYICTYIMYMFYTEMPFFEKTPRLYNIVHGFGGFEVGNGIKQFYVRIYVYMS